MPDNQKKNSIVRRILFFLKFLEIRLRFIFILIVTAAVVGYWDHIQNHYERWQRTHQAQTEGHEGHDHSAGSTDQEWEYYCGMHPFVIRDRPDKCPICGMDLTKRKKGEAMELPEGTLARVQVSPDRIMQGGIEIEPVLYRLLTHTVRSYGVVEAAEGRTSKIVARFPGRIENLMVNAVGQTVSKGQPLASIYSPRFLAASQEYIRAINSQKTLDTKDPSLAQLEKARSEQLAAAARKRLELAGFTEQQLETILKSGKIEDTVTLYSPLSGTVIEKTVLEGESVEEGTALYTIAELSTLWVQVKVLEADISKVKLGMPVEITTVAWPGQIFYGTVDFIYPTLNTENRTIKVRVVVNSPDGKLKPGMFTHAVLRTPAGEETASVENDKAAPVPAATENGDSAKAAVVPLPTQKQEDADKYLSSLPVGAAYYECSMHPEVVSDKETDPCPLCNMKLDKKQKQAKLETADGGSTERWAEGYACAMHPDELSESPGICRTCSCGMTMQRKRIARVLSVPESAVIDTGEKKVVYVETMPGVYDARAITLGQRADKFYSVTDGLSAGQKIVTDGAFLIDAEARLNPSTSKAGTDGAAIEPAEEAGHSGHSG